MNPSILKNYFLNSKSHHLENHLCSDDKINNHLIKKLKIKIFTHMEQNPKSNF